MALLPVTSLSVQEHSPTSCDCLLAVCCLAAAAASGPAGTQRHELVVVASLISKVPNLGGLARTAEVLGAGALVLSDKRVAAEAGFTRYTSGLNIKTTQCLLQDILLGLAVMLYSWGQAEVHACQMQQACCAACFAV